MKSTCSTTCAAAVALGLAACLAPHVHAQGTAGVPATINVGNGQSVATFPSGLGGLSTGSPVTFTPGAAASQTPSPYYVATDAAGSSTLASLNTHYSQGISAATPTTGPPAGISTGIPGGFTGSNTVSILDGSISTIPNAATTYTGPRSTSASAAGASSGAMGVGVDGAKASVVAAVALCVVAGGAWIL
ncbi:conserved hypothetical protein [Sporisorium reilianum SRZ2]|uniref:Uncharacterized protein n=1 Tax=Sporisorium reilianum (strain SRZ2) TaxID=999809 RepID=E7A0M8_SPORE|nr:conserved hypothetical protein [Sporisorium reilianum SRZ2]